MKNTMKTLLLNPPSFENYDGGASSRWPATREIESYWYPVWLAYPAALIENSRLLDAPPHHLNADQVIQIAKDYEFLVLFTSTAGIQNDIQFAEHLKEAKPDLKIAFVGPHVTILPEPILKSTDAIDFIARKEFDFTLLEYTEGKPLDQIAGVSYKKEGKVVHTAERLPADDLDKIPWVTPIYKRDLQIERYNVPFLLNPFIALYSSRGCPAQCSFCLWPQTFDGHVWRTRSSKDFAAECAYAVKTFPQIKEIFFDDDSFTIRKSRILEVCKELEPIGFQWSCTSRVNVDLETLEKMKGAGCRLLIVGFESGDDQILKNIQKGADTKRARQFMKDCKKVGIHVHADFIVGLPGETKETIEKSIKFACELDSQTMQVSIAHPYPGTRFDEYLRKNNFLKNYNLADQYGQQTSAAFEYPGLTSLDLFDAQERFYKRYYYRPHVVARILWDAMKCSEERQRLYKEAKEWFRWLKRRKEYRSNLGTA